MESSEKESPEEGVAYKPIMDWESQESWGEDLVWWSILDNRYQIEVQRQVTETTIDGESGVPDDSQIYAGILLIFDHQKDDQLLYREHVRLSYGAVYGPDVVDVAVWQEKVINFIDGLS